MEEAISLHHDTIASDFEAACRRSYRIALLAPALFARYPELKIHVGMFSDMVPLNWQQDGVRLGLRKLLRRCSATPAATWLLNVLIRLAERTASVWALRPLYRWAMGAYLCRGYHDGLQLLKTVELPFEKG